MSFSVKVNGTDQLRKSLSKMTDDARKEFNKSLAPKIKRQITRTIKSGKSPVAGFGTYEKYSEGYAKAKKGGKRKPVTLTESGKMLRSLTFRSTKEGFTLLFTSAIAKFHDLPGLARVLRKMLPSLPGQRFIPIINKLILKESNDAIRKSIRKNGLRK